MRSYLSFTILCFISILFISSASIVFSNGFQQVIDHTTDTFVKAKLETYRKGGIEKAVDTTNYTANAIIEYAKTFIGTPHVMGGTTKKGIDCSGLIQVTHKKYGVILPHSSHEQGRYGTIIPDIGSLQKGDLLFYYSSYNSSNFITHVGIYLGDSTFIHASNNNGVVITNTRDKYWKDKYLFATRFH